LDLNYHINFRGYSDPDRDRSLLKDVQGKYRLNLFHEFNTHDTVKPIYTMREEPFNGLPSAYLIYMHSLTEYEAAMKLVGSWNHWQRLCLSPPFMNGVPTHSTWSGLRQWREEKEFRDKTEMFNLLKIAAATGNVAAQKILFEKDKVGVRGRPSKAQVEQAAKDAAAHEEVVKDDLTRLRLVSNNGS